MYRLLNMGLRSILVAGVATSMATAAPPPKVDFDRSFTDSVRPFLASYCLGCHTGTKAMSQLDLSRYSGAASVVEDSAHWMLVAEKITSQQMPPKQAKQPDAQARQQVVDWIGAVLKAEARKNAGDPGVVLARRLSNAEYNYSIRDLTGVDLRPAREFPIDPANLAGFDNSGESLSMSPALLNKYLQAAREVANHMVLKPTTMEFAPHPMLVETDRDKYAVKQIVDFYARQDTDYADYFQAAWRLKHRIALGQPKATLVGVAAKNKVSPKYLATIWKTLEGPKEEIGPLAKLQTMWRELPAPKGNQPEIARAGCEQMRDFVVKLRKKTELRFNNLSVKGIGGTSQPFLMWRNREYATHRTDFDRKVLQVEGQPMPMLPVGRARVPADDGEAPAPMTMKPAAPDPDLQVPAGQRARYEAAFARFSAVFPDHFYIRERGRYYPDETRDPGRLLSAGFHNLMGYFRDDQPLYQIVLDAKQQKELDELWRELDFIASANIRTYVQFYFNESGEARGTSRESEGPRPADKDVTSEASIHQVADAYKARASSNPVAVKAIEDHFRWVNDGVRWVEQARTASERHHLEDLQKFAAKAYRRALSASERADLLGFYRSLRDKNGLTHEEAMRDSVVGILMSPDFCYRIDLVEAGGSRVVSMAKPNIRTLSDQALASRLSYFLWSSMPDEELLTQAATGGLRNPVVLRAQARRMLKDDRAKALAVEFAGNWLDFRRFDELNTVDRERFPSFDNNLRQAMFEEPIAFIADVVKNDRSVLDFIYANRTFVNAPLAKHYGMTGVAAKGNEWVRVEDARPYGRGGLLAMSAFLTKNAPGLRTSPVKRGYWVVKRVLGEQIPPPPAVVPELPQDEAKSDLPLREMLAKHREDASCASCHARFDSFGLAMEGYGPVGEIRTKDLAGRPVDAKAAYPDGSEASGFEGMRAYIRAHREKDFVDNICRKMLVYALGRSVILSDEPVIEQMRANLARNNYRFSALIETIVTSPQFLTKRMQEILAQKTAPQKVASKSAQKGD